MITILGRDGIPAILDPVFAGRGAESKMDPAERVIGCPSMARTGPIISI